MPERAARADAVRAGRPLHVGAVTLVPVERIQVRRGWGAPGAFLLARLEPYALVVRDAGGVRALPVGAGEVSLDELRRRIPGLDALLSAA